MVVLVQLGKVPGTARLDKGKENSIIKECLGVNVLQDTLIVHVAMRPFDFSP